MLAKLKTILTMQFGEIACVSAQRRTVWWESEIVIMIMMMALSSTEVIFFIVMDMDMMITKQVSRMKNAPSVCARFDSV
jgi:hypothetical protein